MEFISLLPKAKQNNVSILNVSDKLTNTIYIIPLPDKYDATLVSHKFIETIYRHYGFRQKLICYRDSIFMSKF